MEEKTAGDAENDHCRRYQHCGLLDETLRG